MPERDKIVDIERQVQFVSKSHSELRERVDQMEPMLHDHAVILAQMRDTHAMTREMLDIFNSVKGGFKVIGWVGAAVKFIWPLAAIGMAIWIYIKTGDWKVNP